MALDRSLLETALPGYDIGDEIGRGGWGAVHRGHHRALDRDVAIKQLPRAFAADQRALDRFIDEARTIGQLDHPHILSVYDFVSHEGMWLIVMEFLGGGTLWDRFNADGFRADQSCAITLAICSALEEAHEHGILHRDIKPENIMFSTQGTVTLGDFGIAKTVDRATRHTAFGEVVGTPTYMSPEQALGDDLDAASDVYSLGVVLYELLAGRLPFPEARSPTQQLVQHVSEEPIPLSESAPDIPGAISDVVMTSLEKRPSDRYASAQAFGIALARAAGESFGAGWLQNSGVELMGGGKIQAAAFRAPTMGAPVRQPTSVRPVLREDHFRPVAESQVEPEPGPPADPQPTIAPTAAAVGAVATSDVSAFGDEADPSQTSPPESPAETTRSDPTLGSVVSEPPPVPASPTAPVAAVATEDPPPPPNGTAGGLRRRAPLLAVLGLALVLGGVGLYALLNDSDSTYDGFPTTTVTPTTVAPTTVAPTTVAPTTTEVPQVLRVCPAGERCAFFDSAIAVDDQLVVEWTAEGFDPIIAPGQFHVHFFWDIYSPDQAGTNAGTFGVSQGEWELTADQPFWSEGEMLLSNRPEAAKRICVTVTNAAHAVVNPLQFDCVPIPDGPEAAGA